MKDRRTRIVEAATTVMARQGFQDTSIDDVIREAGLCGKGHFYHYFRSKEELGYAVLRHQFERFAERGLAQLRDPLTDPLTRLSLFIDGVVATHLERGCTGGSPCGALVTEMAGRHEGFRQRVDQLLERWTAQIQALLWEVRPQLRDDVDIARLARFVVATLEGALFMSRVKRDAATLEGVAADLKRYVASHVRDDAEVARATTSAGAPAGGS